MLALNRIASTTPTLTGTGLLCSDAINLQNEGMVRADGGRMKESPWSHGARGRHKYAPLKCVFPYAVPEATQAESVHLS